MRVSPVLRSVVNSAAARMARPRITLYVDTVSPFAYEAYYLLRNDQAFKSCDVTYVPIFLGGLMHKCGNTPPLKIKNKDKWIGAERLRWARQFSIPMADAMPPDFPAPTLPIMRALGVIARSDGGDAAQPRLTRALDTLFEQHWVRGVATHRPEVLRETLAGLFGAREAEQILTESTTPQGKQLLADNTDRAFADGAFGLPWMVCTNARGETEGFWGVDHLGQVARFLGLPMAQGGSEGWKALL